MTQPVHHCGDRPRRHLELWQGDHSTSSAQRTNRRQPRQEPGIPVPGQGEECPSCQALNGHLSGACTLTGLLLMSRGNPTAEHVGDNECTSVWTACNLQHSCICPALALRCCHVTCAYLKICPASLTGLSGALRHAVNAVLSHKANKPAVLLTYTAGPCATSGGIEGQQKQQPQQWRNVQHTQRCDMSFYEHGSAE